MLSEYSYPFPAQRTYADLYKPSTKWHTVWQKHCGTVVCSGKGPMKPDLIRTVKTELAGSANPARNKTSSYQQ